MTLRPAQLRRIASELGAPDTFVLVEARVPPIVHRVYSRPWAKAGYASVQLPDLVGLVPEDLARQVTRDVRVVALVVPADVSLDPNLLKHLNVCATSFVMFEVDATGRMMLRGSPVADDCPDMIDWGKTTELTLHARQVIRLTKVDLPREVPLELPQDDEGLSIIGIEGLNPRCSMPEKVWYRLTGAPTGVLQISIRPDDRKDSWRISYAGDDGRVQRISVEDGVGRPGRLPRRLIVILDRTCPDRDAWSAARRLLLEGPPPQNPGATVRPYPDFNLAIRMALGEALATQLQASGAQVEGWWVSDVPGEGMAQPEGITVPASAWGRAGSAPPERAPELFSHLTYSPGLDLWDPVDGALDAVVNDIGADTDCAILIVGNSPPEYPTQIRSPLGKLARIFGFTTSWKRWTGKWYGSLERLERLHVPVAYLFLTHDRPSCHDEEKDFAVFRDLQVRVKDALGEGLPVVSETADKAGVERGLEAALKILSSPPLSRIRVMR